MSRAQQIEQRAALWVLAREERDWSAHDQSELDAWLNEADAHKVAFWRLEAGWRDADRIASLGVPRSLHAAKLTRWQPLALAASLLIIFAFTLVQWPLIESPRPGQPAPTQFETPVGGHQVVTLDDGSRVELNTNTRIKALITDRARVVWLDRGEAFFDIAKRSGRDFVIHAGKRTVTVLGTKFSVSREGPQTVVAVLEGRVRVAEDKAGEFDGQTTITAGDVAIASDGSTTVTKASRAVTQRLAWRTGLLLFESDTLADAAEEINRYNRKHLVVADAEAAKMIVSGSFRAREVGSFARTLARMHDLDVREGTQEVILSSRKRFQNPPAKAVQVAYTPPPPAPPKVAKGCGASCAVIPLAAASIHPEIARAAEVKAMRDERNWSVLHRLYPRRALEAREEGLVGFTVRIDSRGDPTQCRITQSSGHPLLDMETCQLIMVHADFKRPSGGSRSQQRWYEGVVNWKLPAATAAAPVASPPIASKAEVDEMICKRFPRTGSNVAIDRVCMRKSEWSRESGTLWQEKGRRN